MMTLQGMADQRFTSVSLFTNVFLGGIFFPLILMRFQQLEHVVAHIQNRRFDAVSTVRTCCGTHTKSPRKWCPKVNKTKPA